MKEQIASLRQAALEELGTLNDLKQLEDFRVRYMGKKGSVTALLRGMGALSAEERPVMGQLVNQLRQELEEAVSAKMQAIQEEQQKNRLAAETLDVTMPGKKDKKGKKKDEEMGFFAKKAKKLAEKEANRAKSQKK